MSLLRRATCRNANQTPDPRMLLPHTLPPGSTGLGQGLSGGNAGREASWCRSFTERAGQGCSAALPPRRALGGYLRYRCNAAYSAYASSITEATAS